MMKAACAFPIHLLPPPGASTLEGRSAPTQSSRLNPASDTGCSAPRCKEVWLFAFSMIARIAARIGLDLAPLCDGLGFSPADCASQGRRIDWEDFVVLLDRCSQACGGLDAFEQIVCDELRAIRGSTPLSGLCTSPRGVYLEMVSWVFLNGYQSLDFVAIELVDGRIQWSCTVRPEYSPSEPSMRAICAMARAFSGLCDLPPASVEASWTDRECECLITLPAHPTQHSFVKESPSRVVTRPHDGCSHRVRQRVVRWDLSPREAQVFELVAKGKQNKEVASILEVSVKTVEKHVGNVMVKARVHSRTELLSALLQG